MLTALLFDDEKLALKALEKQLNNFDNITVTGMFTTYEGFIKKVKDECPDIAFIDIKTPYKSGLEIAQELKSIDSKIEIVFVTAYREYAYVAYEIEASDYILKPAGKKRLKRVIDKVQMGKSSERQKKAPEIFVKTMKKFEARNKTGDIIKWRTKKVEELLAYLVQHKGQEVDSGTLIEALWPDAGIEKAKKLLYTNMYYLRKNLAPYGVKINIKGRKYILPKEKVQCDLDHLTNSIDKIITSHQFPQSLEDFFALYPGGYLEENDFKWAEEKRNELESRFINTVLKTAEYFIEHNRLFDAELSLKRLIRIYPGNEYPYKMIMQTYRLMNDRQGLAETYKSYCKMMQELGLGLEENDLCID